MARNLKKSNLILKGSGMDVNGNRIVKLEYPNSRGFSIQTLSALPKTHKILRGLKTEKDMYEVSETDLLVIEKEVVAYIKENGSDTQKKKLKIYK